MNNNNNIDTQEEMIASMIHIKELMESHSYMICDINNINDELEEGEDELDRQMRIKYSKIYYQIIDYLKEHCQHEIITDTIDIDGDRSQTVYYCTKCYTIPSS